MSTFRCKTSRTLPPPWGSIRSFTFVAFTWSGFASNTSVISSLWIRRKLPVFLEKSPILCERLEPDPAVARNLDPVVPEPLTVVVQDRRIGLDEPLPLRQDVVVGKSDEVITRFLVAIDDHFRKVIAVAPKRVGVEVSLSTRWGWTDGIRPRRPESRTGEIAYFSSTTVLIFRKAPRRIVISITHSKKLGVAPVDCPSCGRANASDRVECSNCEELLVDVFESREEKTDPIMAIGRDLSVETDDVGNDSGDGFTRFPTDVQYSGDLPRLFRFGNRYQVLEKLGEGGMGRVYKALDLELDRAVALKTIRTEKGRGPEVLKRFKQELVLARKITHKNVVRIYDLGEAEGGVKFFTMELVEGKSLRDLLNEKKTFSTKEAISFMKQMLSGLAEAHSQGVVHRDLKPQNIMVDESGVLRIMDFGIARTADTATLTGTGEMMGTPDYISPEQVKGDTTTAQSDLYSTGIILYELLTGDVPFKGDTAISKVVARLQVKPTPPRTLNPQIPPYLERIILKLMEVDPDLRYKTADEVLQDIEREQVDSSLFLRTRKAILRHRGWIAAVLVGSLGLAVWLLGETPSGEVTADVPVTTIAILPFHNMTGNAELAWMENWPSGDADYRHLAVGKLETSARRSRSSNSG